MAMALTLDVTTLALLSGVIVAAQVVETVTGFGATVIALSLGVHLVPLETLVVALVVIGLAQSTWLVARGRRDIRMRLLLTRIVPFCVVGLVAGNALYFALGTGSLKPILGGFVVAIAAFELVRLYRGKAQPGPLRLPASGALLVGGGFFHGLFASGGPLVVYYASRAIDDKKAFRATLSLLWLLLNTVLLISYVAHAQLGSAASMLAASLVPALVLGIAIGEWVHHRVDEVVFRKVVQGVLLFTGLFLLL